MLGHIVFQYAQDMLMPYIFFYFHLHFPTEKRDREVGGAVENAGCGIRDVQVDGRRQQDRRRVIGVNAVVANSPLCGPTRNRRCKQECTSRNLRTWEAALVTPEISCGNGLLSCCFLRFRAQGQTRVRVREQLHLA